MTYLIQPARATDNSSTSCEAVSTSVVRSRSSASVSTGVAASPGTNDQTQKLRIYGCLAKRTFDVAASFILLILAVPLIAMLAAVVALDGGYPFFAHLRVGRGGRAFACYKLRSMVIDADAKLKELLDNDLAAAHEWQKHQKITNDPRVTRIGRFLRSTGLDELPQLWNVFRGDMSLVGPRPITTSELPRYGGSVEYYLAARPGLTGLWQISARHDLSYDERVALDVYYFQSLSFWNDFRIVILTAASLARARGR